MNSGTGRSTKAGHAVMKRRWTRRISLFDSCVIVIVSYCCSNGAGASMVIARVSDVEFNSLEALEIAQCSHKK